MMMVEENGRPQERDRLELVQRQRPFDDECTRI